MTDLQVKYWANVENERSHRAQEDEMRRSNLVKERQTQERIAFQNQLDQARAEEASSKVVLNQTQAWKTKEEGTSVRRGRILDTIGRILNFPTDQLQKMARTSSDMMNAVSRAVRIAAKSN